MSPPVASKLERLVSKQAVSPSHWTRAIAVAFALYVALHAGIVLHDVATLPFFSEDWLHLTAASSIGSLAEALDPAREPLRPLQHLVFHVLSRSTDPSPVLVRLVAFAVHVGACALVFVLARELGAGRRGAALAMLLFYAFPSVKGWVWVAAISAPLRVFFLLAALCAFVVHRRKPSHVTGFVLVVGGLLALLAHESAVILPVLCALWVVTGAEDVVALRRKLASLLADPWFLATCASALAWTVWLAALRPQRYHGWRGLENLPANVAKASLALVPEALREPCIAGLRGEAGTFGLILAGVALLALQGAFVLLVWRGSHVMRFAILAVAADLLLPVLSAGFVQRYAIFSAAIVACALGCGWKRRPTPLRLAGLIVLFLFWCADAREDAHEYAQAGRTQAAVLAVAQRERAGAGPELPIAFVDLPAMGGDEQDLPLFNWGLPQMFERANLAGPWLFWRTKPYDASTDVRLVTEAEIDAARASGMRVLVHEEEAPAPVAADGPARR